MNSNIALNINGSPYLVEVIDTGREINFSVFSNGEYLFRLVSDNSPFDGFVISPLDKSLDHDIDYSLVHAIGVSIENHFM